MEVDTALLLETLRNMQSYRNLTPSAKRRSTTKSRGRRPSDICLEYPEYRASLRAVSQLSGADGGVSKPSLTIGELEGALSPEVRCIYAEHYTVHDQHANVM